MTGKSRPKKFRPILPQFTVAQPESGPYTEMIDRSCSHTRTNSGVRKTAGICPDIEVHGPEISWATQSI